MKLFEAVTFAGLHLKNRVVMAPLTRQRADSKGIPFGYVADYYSQRAMSAGLIIAEGTQPSFEGQGYCRTPGIHTPEQMASWKNVTDAVHKEGSKIFIQIMHAGRIGHSLNRTVITPPIAPSAIKPAGQIWTDQKQMQDYPEPSAIPTSSIPALIEEFVHASRCAIQAGFDGVELHAANGYLLNQFLSSNSNHRNDQYGGPVENRIRFCVELVEAVGNAIGLGKTAIRVSPGHMFNDLVDAQPTDTHRALLKKLPTKEMAYVHLMFADAFSPQLNNAGSTETMIKMVREETKGNLIAAGNLNPKSAEDLIQNGTLQLAVFGRPFIANPDLVDRWQKDRPLAQPNDKLFYTPGPEGYSDYPVWKS